MASILVLLALTFGAPPAADSTSACRPDSTTAFTRLDSLFASTLEQPGAAAFLDCLEEDPLGTGTRLLLLRAPLELHFEDSGDGRSYIRIGAGPPLAIEGPAAADHWKKLAAFRDRHVAIEQGEHRQLPNKAYTFGRTYRQGRVEDRVIVVVGALGRTTVTVSHLFPDDVTLRDAYTGRTAFVSFGMVTFDAHENGLILIEEVTD